MVQPKPEYVFHPEDSVPYQRGVLGRLGYDTSAGPRATPTYRARFDIFGPTGMAV